jgi:hypothetical protein
MRDHSPIAHAFSEVQFVIYIELLEDAALFLEHNALSHTQLLESIDASRSKIKKTAAPVSTRQTLDSDALELPDWHRSGRAARGIGYLFKLKIEGWKLFCNRLGTSTMKLWQDMELPGVDRIKRAVGFAFGGLAFSSASEMATWVNEVRPDGEPECTEADILTAECYATHLYGLLRNRARSWGAD